MGGNKYGVGRAPEEHKVTAGKSLWVKSVQYGACERRTGAHERRSRVAVSERALSAIGRRLHTYMIHRAESERY